MYDVRGTAVSPVGLEVIELAYQGSRMRVMTDDGRFVVLRDVAAALRYGSVTRLVDAPRC